MALPFFQLCALNVLLLGVLIAFSRSQLFGCFAGSATNPLFVFCLISALFNLDFIQIWNHPEIDYLETPLRLSQQTTIEAYATYTFIFAGTGLGCMAAMWYWARKTPPTEAMLWARYDPVATLAAQILFYVIIGIAAPLLLWFSLKPELQGMSYQALIRDNPIVSAAVFVISPVTSLFISHQPKPFSKINIAVLAFVILLLVSSGGSRAIVLLLLLIIGCAYASTKRISAFWYVPIMPAAALFLAFSRYAFREGDAYTSFGDFLDAHGGLLNLFFDGEEISFAKMFASLYEFKPILQNAPYPFQNLLALLLLPIPRSFLAWKPLGGSALFTQQISPFRWEWTKSEMLITGYGDMYWQFGTLGTFIVMFALGCLWMGCCIKAIQHSRQTAICWTPLLIWWMYAFVRGDLFNISLLLWPALIVYLAHWSIKNTLSLIRRQFNKEPLSHYG